LVLFTADFAISITNYGAQGRLNFVFLNPKRKIEKTNKGHARLFFFCV